MNRDPGQAKNRSVQAVAIAEGLQYWQPDGVPVEDDGFVIVRAPPHHTQRARWKMFWPARRP